MPARAERFAPAAGNAWLGPARGLRGAGIVGLGSALPKQRVSSEQLGRRLGVSAEWIMKRTGIRSRRYAAAGEEVSELAARAGRCALDDARLEGAQIDALLVATVSADQITPGVAPAVAHALGATGGPALDVSAACVGSLAALAHATAWIECGRAERVLVIAAEILSRFIDFDDRRSAPLFGDGAGAIVLAADAPGVIGPFVFGSDGGRASVLQVSRRRGVLEMDGHETFRQAVARLSESTTEVLERAGLSAAEVDLFVYHQANARILQAVGQRLGLAPEKVFVCIEELGNTSAASLPLALHAAASAGALSAGARVLIGAFGAGLGWGAALLSWGSA